MNFGGFRTVALHRVCCEGYWTPVITYNWFYSKPLKAEILWHNMEKPIESTLTCELGVIELDLKNLTELKVK